MVVKRVDQKSRLQNFPLSYSTLQDVLDSSSAWVSRLILVLFVPFQNTAP